MAEITNNEGWVTISDDSGSGNESVTATVNSPNTGRNARSVTLKGVTSHGDEAESVITQSGLEEFVSFDQPSYYIANNVTHVTITGKSNSKRLSFSMPKTDGTTVDYLQPIKSYFVSQDGTQQSVVNGQEISGDPGADGEYTFILGVSTKDSTPSYSRVQNIIATTYNGNTTSVSVTQAGVSSTILFDGYAHGKVYDITNLPVGGAQTINIGLTPNGEDWSIAFDEQE
jgi:hypothetical protein